MTARRQSAPARRGQVDEKPPSSLLLAAELPRALLGAVELAARWPELRQAPRGDGRPVLILPGLANADWANVVLRRHLNRLGYRARGWGLGRNRGARTIGVAGERLERVLADMHAETGEPVTLVGISLGGLMTRLMAHRHPDMVREVITISAPFAGDPRATNVWRAFEWLTGEKVDAAEVRENLRLAALPPPVPTTAIWSASDGLVSGAICHSPSEPAVEVRSGHLWVQLRPSVLLAVVGILAQSRPQP
jgi:triacylglycerol lipase